MEEVNTVTIIDKPKSVVLPKQLLQLEEEAQVIIHCTLPVVNDFNYARIWPSTFLVCNQTGKKIQLAHYEGISLYPYWTEIEPRKRIQFTLIFKGLPKACTSFNLVEEINEPGGFERTNISRNRADIYKVILD